MSAICVTGVFADSGQSIGFGWIDESGNVHEMPQVIRAYVVVDGKEFGFDAFNILDFNFFKLRDLAYVLSGTAAQFDVGFDEKTGIVSITCGKPYTVVGGEMANKHQGLIDTHYNVFDGGGTLSQKKILVDGAEVSLTAYNNNNNNFFRLRCIAAALDFSVDWDGRVIIDTSKGYTGEIAPPITEEDLITGQAEGFHESQAEAERVREFFENIPLDKCELIPESVKVFKDVYEFTVGERDNPYTPYAELTFYAEWVEFAKFDKDGIHRAGFVADDDREFYYMLVIKRDNNGTLTGMVYKVQL
jgi:hypothetical protein